jgi:hypothetical protein
VNSVNPFRLEGQKTAAFELADELGGDLDALCIPVGNAGNITAYWKGFVEMGQSPRMLGFQAAGSAPLVDGAPVEHPETVASAIRIGNPARWEEAMGAMTASGGAIRAVTDDEILDAYRFWPPTRGSSASRRRRRGSRGCSPTGPRAPTGSRASSPGTASRTRRRLWPTRGRSCRASRTSPPSSAPSIASGALMHRRRLVRVPASSANLGPGFDVLAAALGLHVEVEVEETGRFAVHTDLAIARNRRNLCVRAFQTLHPVDDFEFTIRSAVPLAVGWERAPRPTSRG